MGIYLEKSELEQIKLNMGQCEFDFYFLNNGVSLCAFN